MTKRCIGHVSTADTKQESQEGDSDYDYTIASQQNYVQLLIFTHPSVQQAASPFNKSGRECRILLSTHGEVVPKLLPCIIQGVTLPVYTHTHCITSQAVWELTPQCALL
ncbi:hypothetical protein E2C01_024947 [Portunus trituberculatus]|uniref:Uncharacterized protein n=1 Tax=Portunus trituberculatus TaxID=210409 RepID=A0A5B7EBX7_PORTR|nr:hypothetical protein [Portunus trituberculatus]